MTFLTSVIEAFQTKPTTQAPTLGPADQQNKLRMEAIEASKVRRADAIRRAQLEHRLADEDRTRLTEKREALVASRKFTPAELHIIDCELEVALAVKAFERNPGEPIILGDGTTTISKQKARVNIAKRALKSAEEAHTRMQIMISNGPQEVYATPVDLRGYTDARVHMQQTLASIKERIIHMSIRTLQAQRDLEDASTKLFLAKRDYKPAEEIAYLQRSVDLRKSIFDSLSRIKHHHGRRQTSAAERHTRTSADARNRSCSRGESLRQLRRQGRIQRSDLLSNFTHTQHNSERKPKMSFISNSSIGIDTQPSRKADSATTPK